MRVLICGGRDFQDGKIIFEWLQDVRNACPVECVIEGGAKGADTLGKIAAFTLGIPVMEFPANWPKYGNGAGPRRNQDMIDIGQPDLCLAFPTPASRGTWDMIKRVENAGIEVKIYE